MKHLLSLLKKLIRNERGILGLSILAVTSAILLGAAVGHYLGGGTVTRHATTNINIIDESELNSIQKASLAMTPRETVNEQGETVINIVLNDTDLVPESQDSSKPVPKTANVFGPNVQADITNLIAARQSVAQTAPAQRQAGGKSDAAIGKILSENNLRPDQLNTDIYKTVENLVAENSVPNMVGDAADSVTSSVMKTISQNISRGASEQTLQTVIKSELNKQKMLAEPELIDNRKRLKLLEETKAEYQKQVAVIDQIVAEGGAPWAKNMVDYKDYQRIIGELDSKIAAAQNSIAAPTGRVTNIPSNTTAPTTVPPNTTVATGVPANTPAALSVPTNPRVAIGALHVSSTPAGADIWLDGSKMSMQAPRTISNIAQGPHNITLKIPGYQDYSKTIRVVVDETTSVSAKLIPLPSATGILSIGSIEKDVTILINNTTQDKKTPASFKNVPVGSYRVTLKKAGFQDYSATVEVEPMQEAFVWAQLKPLPPQLVKGSLNIASVPAGADIYINGQNRGRRTPCNFVNTEPGISSVLLKKAGYKDYSRNIDVKEGRITELSANLEASVIAKTPDTNKTPQQVIPPPLKNKNTNKSVCLDCGSGDHGMSAARKCFANPGWHLQGVAP
jgi:hypothetical protein